MSVLEQTQQNTVIYGLDKLHSSATFAVEHNSAATFRGSVGDINARVTVGAAGVTITGSARADSIEIEDGDLRSHVLSPEFLDAESHKTIDFESTAIRYEDGETVVEGNLTLRGVTHHVGLRGQIGESFVDVAGANRLAVRLGVTIDRTGYGLNWQLALPNGKPILGKDVRLDVELELVEVT